MSPCDVPPACRADAPRIVHLSTVHHVHDVRITVKEAASLARAGFRVTVVARTGETTPGLPPNVTLDSLPPARSRAARLLEIRGAVVRALAHRPALVHVHDPELLAAVPSLRRAGVPVVYDMHENLSKQIYNKPWVPRWSKTFVEHLITRVEPALVARCDGLVVVDAAWLDRHDDIPHAVLRNLPLAREAASRAPTIAVHRRPPRLVYAGGVDDSRGATLMAKAVHATAEARPSIDIRLDACGPIRPPTLAAELARHDPKTRMSLHGWLDRERLLDLLDEARAGLLMLAPHPNYEHAYATKLFEYLRAGLPVIASDLASHRTVIERYECGLIVPHGDTAALAMAMRRLVEDDALTERLAAGARRAWLASTTFDSEFDNLLALYEKLGVRAPIQTER